MLRQLEQEFGRYFLQVADAGNQRHFGVKNLFAGAEKVSTIIENSLYLSNLPQAEPFSTYPKLANGKDAALVVSCVDIPELAKSSLLLEPGSDRVKYHVLAMEDIIAKTGSIDQIFDALALMSSFADQKKPIHVHCVFGVGRSAMMTALHLSYRYLQGDPIVTAGIDKQYEKTLDPKSDNFIVDLYTAAAEFVLSKRACCQFGDDRRNNLAFEILTVIRKNLQVGQPIAGHRGEDYRFLAELTQSFEFKRLQYFHYQVLTTRRLPGILSSLLLNQEGWYENLIQHTKTIESQPHEIRQLYSLLDGLVDAVNRIAKIFPQAPQSQHIASVNSDLLTANQKTESRYNPTLFAQNITSAFTAQDALSTHNSLSL